MIDPDLERRISDCTELVDTWKTFLDLVNKAVRSDATTISKPLEDQFLSAKTRIAMLHESFTDSLKHDKKIGQNMIDLVNRSISLKAINASHESEQKKLEIEWHECFLLLNETISALNERKELLADRNEFLWKLGKQRDRMISNIKAFLSSIYFKIGLGLTIFLFVVWGVPAFGIYDYDQLRDVKSIKKPLTTFYDIMRNMGGFSFPYVDIADYRAIIEKQDGKGLEIAPYDVTMDAAVNSIKGKLHVPSKSFPEQTTIGEELKTAQAFHAWKISDRTKIAYGYVFWFRKTKDAKAFELNHIAGQSLASDFKFTRKVNVITIIWAPGGEGHMKNTMNNYFDRAAP